ncbi:glycosyltransferase [Xanthomonas melonis]|uniref:Glycosyltransferase n=1 Tax=Xanthomonas melonis TaxID=56456 RepID=A0ABS8NZW0_9XANT|nr:MULTISPECIES: glycosyltransferase [Xanthomonas]MCC4586094.1 glycosyltransferase [Xanthomonas sp. NCPPB 1067]MCD0246704.1 glycosyltransferase [Xanthomonas melonis]MCD0260442.1 glycosyltransferase [Xanthomonas melonis]MCD0268648.1 glycosyltransferase [Xanthomonas melonis]
MSNINDKDYWDGRFDSDWTDKRGREQSRFFARLALSMMPEWLKWTLADRNVSLLDWGCAMGDGTDALAQGLAGAKVTGSDFSSAAIIDAAQRYAPLGFVCFDVMTDTVEERWDFVFSSNTLEHFREPWMVLSRLAPLANTGLILLVPYEEFLRIDEHFYTFESANIPFEVVSDFVLAYSRVIDGAQLPATEWAGKQILLVYLRKNASLLGQLRMDSVASPSTSDFGADAVDQDRLLQQLLDERRSAVQLQLRIAELEGRVQYEQSVALQRNQERDALLLKVEQMHIEHQLERDRACADELVPGLAETHGLAIAPHAAPPADGHTSDLTQELARVEQQDQQQLDGLQPQDSQGLESRPLKSRHAHEQRSRSQRFRVGARETAQSRTANRQMGEIASGISAYLNDLVRQRNELAQALSEVKRSNSWKLTSPIRRLVGGLRGSAVQQDVNDVVQDEVRFEHFVKELEQVKKQLFDYAPAEASNRQIYIFTGVPYDDIGGGQRAAQLARVLLERGEQVTYVYAYRKWENGIAVESDYRAPRLRHLFLERTSVDELVGALSADDVAIFELPHRGFMEHFEHFGRAGARRVFELIDAWDSSLGGEWYSDEVMARYIAESEVVVGTAKVLRDKLVAAGRPDGLYLPNAVNERIFDSYKTYARPHEFEAGKRALLYFGSLYGEWFDWECIDAAARAGTGTTNIYLIGDPPAGREVRSNVHFLGSRKIDELPAYLRHCTAALLPFIPGHISDAVSPIKVFEYLAMGVPVIANALPELVGYPNVLIAENADEFANLCITDLEANPARVDAFLMANTWASRADAIVPARNFGRIVSAVVLIHNNARIIERCIRSLKMHGEDYLADIIVVDNASSDGGAELVERLFPDVKVLRNAKNGCSSGRNLGAEHASGDVIAFFDSDQWITNRGCFEEALQVLDGNSDIGAVGWAAGWFSSGGEHLGGPIADYLPHRGTDTEEYRQLGFRTDIAYLGSGGMFIPRDVLVKSGGFDDYYDPTCFEDTDLSFSILNHGFSLAYRDLQGIRHQPHQTTSASAGSDAYSRLFLRNSKYFQEKWKGRPQFFFDVPVIA